jgi:MFS family permease
MSADAPFLSLERGAEDPPPSKPRYLRLLALVTITGALEFYDFVILIFLAPVIGALFFPPGPSEWVTLIQTFGIFGLGYVSRPLGGMALAHFGDLFGRKRALVFSILLMSLATIGISILPTYATIGVAAPLLLLLLRLAQGVAIGGEIPGAWTLVAEHLPLRHVGFGCGLLCSGLTLGIWLGSSITVAVESVFTYEQLIAYGWRIPFLLGGVFGLIAVFLRIWLNETPIFSEMKRQRLLLPEMPLRNIIREHRQGIVISGLLTCYLSAGVIVTALMMPTLLREIYGYTSREALIATSFGTLFQIIGAAMAGALIDRFGIRLFFVFSAVALALTTFAFYSFVHIASAIGLTLHVLVGLAVGMNGGVPYVMVRLFPARVRFSGVSFSYNMAYAIFGGLTPVAMASILPINAMAHAYYLIFIAVTTLVVGIYIYRSKGLKLYPVGMEERRNLGEIDKSAVAR